MAQACVADVLCVEGDVLDLNVTSLRDGVRNSAMQHGHASLTSRL
jgi:hypothetical protein